MAYDNHNNPLDNKVDSANKKISDREIRGYSILAKGDNPKLIDEETFLVPSQSSNKKYKVTLRNEWVCECPDFQHRRQKCKHIYSVEFLLKLRNRLDNDSSLEFADELQTVSRCQFCNSENLVKDGIIKNKSEEKQRYLCRGCNKTFYAESKFNYIRNPKIISMAFDLYFKGLSLRKITDTLNQFFGVKIHHETVRRWLLKFSKAMDDYTKQFTPKVSDAWHLDEQAIKSKGKWLWCWNILDEETRFLISSNITKDRYAKDARKILQMAKATTRAKPSFVITDGLMGYKEAIKREFSTNVFSPFPKKYPQTVHVRLRTIREKPNNNLIERYHNTFRERDKTLRGFKGREQNFVDGFRTYYNFVRPHMSLNTTPAQASGIDLQLDRNKWLSLIKKSLRSSQS